MNKVLNSARKIKLDMHTIVRSYTCKAKVGKKDAVDKTCSYQHHEFILIGFCLI